MHQSLRNYQSEPRAAVAPGIRSIELFKCLEEFRLLVGRNADAGVSDAAMQLDFGACPGFHFDADDNLAAFRKLNGVVHQVDHDLS